MSIQHRDLANAAKELNQSNRFDSDKLMLISQFATLIDDLAPPVSRRMTPRSRTFTRWLRVWRPERAISSSWKGRRRMPAVREA